MGAERKAGELVGSPAHIHSTNQLALDGPSLFLLDNLRWTLYTASTSSFWTDRFFLRAQSYQRRGDLSPFRRPVSYYHVNDIKKSLQLLLDAGAQAQQEVQDVGGGKLIATVKDANSNVIWLIQFP